MDTSLTDAPVRITFSQFCERENIPESTGRHWLHIGYAPPSYLLGKHRVFDLADVVRWESELKKAGK